MDNIELAMTPQDINKELTNHKALDAVIIDVIHLTSITDTIIVCSATSTTHAQTLADKITTLSKTKYKEKGVHVEGAKEGTWILVQTKSCIIHIFTEEKRKLYDIEKLWKITPTEQGEISE